MELWQVAFISIYGGALAWVIITLIQQGKSISSMSTMIEQMMKIQDKMDQKLNLFLKSEIDTLKDLVEKIGKKN